MSRFSFLLTWLVILSVASSQCMYVSGTASSSGSIWKSPVGACQSSSSGNVTASRMLSCTATTVTQTYYSSNDCTGTVTQTNDVTTLYPGARQCTGVPCTITVNSYANADCSGTPTSQTLSFVDTQCSSSSSPSSSSTKSYCDASSFYQYSYGDMDTTCANNQNAPNAYIYEIGFGNCLTSTYMSGNTTITSYQKYSQCTLPASIPKPTLTFANSFILSQYKGANSGCSGVLELKVQSRQDGACIPDSTTGGSSQTFCSGNGGARWEYQWGGAGCTGKLDTAYYMNSGCSPSNGAFSGSLSNTSSFSLGCTGSSPPKIDFGGAPYALIQMYLDSSCSTLVYGGYVRADGTCEVNTPSPGSTGNSSKIVCGANGNIVGTDYNTTTCAAGSEIPSAGGISSFSSTCTKVPNSDLNGDPVWAKVISCGDTALVNPLDAPGLKTLNGAVSKVVGFSLVWLVVAHVLVAV